MKILVINAGSSSLKYKLFNMSNGSVEAKGIAERIGIENSNLKHTPNDGETVKINAEMKTHTDAIELVIKALVDKDHGVIKEMSEISAVGHRVLHGGSKFIESVIINEEVKDAIKDNFKFGPLHNPANLMGIEACEKVIPGTPQVAVFDTAFHQSMPDKAYMYAIPYELYEKHGIRKYGFHGTSHKYVSKMVAKKLDKEIQAMKIITCHLGNGSSIAAVKNGKCCDTSMGLTPLEGLPMGTRCGDIDPTVVSFLEDAEGIPTDEINSFLNKKCGVLGVSGVSSDFRDLEAAMNEGNKRAKLALDLFSYRVAKTIGSYAAAMNGVDCIVFTGGIGENTNIVRESVCEYLGFLGVKLDLEKNLEILGRLGREGAISTPDSRVDVIVVPTNEELMIAQETVELI